VSEPSAEPTHNPAPAGAIARWRKVAALVVALSGAALVGRSLSGAAPRDTRVSVGLADHREGAARAERVSVSFAQGGEVVQRVEQRFGQGATVPARWSRALSLVPGRYDVRVEVVSGRGLLVRDEPVEVSADGVDLRAPR
jgi:hypothetical protein